MKKYLIAAFIAMMTCLAVLSGCAAVKGLERDVQVILENDGEYVGTYTVNQFNNAVVPEMEKEDLMFRGWSVLEDWTEEDGDYYLTENTGLIRYDDIKDFVVGDSLSITLYAAYAPIPARDLVIAWYDKETTSGLNQSYMDSFKTQLYAYLTSQGYSPESMDIVIRGYSGDVGTTCSEIMKDSDVDIMVGWSSNIDTTGGMTEGADFIMNVGGVSIGTAERYAALLTNTELSKLVYTWIFDTYSDVTLPEIPETPVDPDPQPEPQSQLVIGWYAKSDTSGLDQTIVSVFTRGLKEYLESSGTECDVIVRGYDGKVDDVISAVDADGDVDIMVGMKAFDYDGVMDVQNDVAMGEKTDRRIHLLDDDALTLAVFDWLKTDDARALFTAAQEAPLAA